MRILVITNQIPYPPISGAPLRTYSLVRRLAEAHEVYLAAFTASEKQTEGIAHLLRVCREVVALPAKSLRDARNWGSALEAILSGEPPELRMTYSAEMAGKIGELARRVDLDAVQIEHGCMGMYLEALPAQLRKRTVWGLHDIDFDKFARIARTESRLVFKVRAWMHSRAMRRWQPGIAGRFGLCHTVSEVDRQILLTANPQLEVKISPNGVDTKRLRPLHEPSESCDMLFIGNMEYAPNADAAVYFCQKVLPLVRRQLPGARLWIVGIDPPPSIQQLAGNGVFVTGGVPDVVPYYERATVCVVPLRAGSGTRLKILEAMALGRPVISTSIGCEGLNVVKGEHLLVADNANSFAAQVVSLLTDSGLRSRIAGKAREFVVERYDWDVIAQELVRQLTQVAGPEDASAS